MKIAHTLLKTLSYAAMHMTLAVAVAYVLSGSWKVALAIGTIEPMVQTVGFFFHEKAWHRAEKKLAEKDYHDDVINSVSPVTKQVEDILNKQD